MFRHQKYLEIPWNLHWQREGAEPHRHHWWLIAFLLLLALCLIGVGVTYGLL